MMTSSLLSIPLFIGTQRLAWASDTLQPFMYVGVAEAVIVSEVEVPKWQAVWPVVADLSSSVATVKNACAIRLTSGWQTSWSILSALVLGRALVAGGAFPGDSVPDAFHAVRDPFVGLTGAFGDSFAQLFDAFGRGWRRATERPEARDATFAKPFGREPQRIHVVHGIIADIAVRFPGQRYKWVDAEELVGGGVVGSVAEVDESGVRVSELGVKQRSAAIPASDAIRSGRLQGLPTLRPPTQGSAVRVKAPARS
jgi:hypothetical protein